MYRKGYCTHARAALTQNRAASFQATRRCREACSGWLAGWLAAFLASIDPIGEASATATPNTFSRWLLAKMSVHTAQNRRSAFESTKLLEVPGVEFQLVPRSDTQEKIGVIVVFLTIMISDILFLYFRMAEFQLRYEFYGFYTSILLTDIFLGVRI